ncbi:MAG TPA: anti-sigma factor [Burkholderiales bacterium]|nr:anti-sigma factor [Burkholderiales bacterium]
MIPTDPAERNATAAEYVIGTLSDAEHTEFEHAMARDFVLQQDVYYWQDKLLPMTRMLAPVEPSPAVWLRIERNLQTASRGTEAPKRPWWAGLNFWRYGAVAASLIAAVLALKLIVPATTPEAIRYVAVLQSPDKKDAGWIVEASAGGKLRLTPLGTTTVGPQKVLQFWTKAQSASGPTSLGLVAPDRVTEIDVARLPVLEREQLFELTLEPEGGSTIGRPTGPILYVGRTVAMNIR